MKMLGVFPATLVAIALAQGIAAQSCTTIPVVKGAGTLVFAIIGDWGRLGGVKSVDSPANGGFDLSGACVKNFNDSRVQDAEGAIGQLTVASSMNRYVKWAKAQFVIGTGDNFYECGVDTPLRIDMDWARVYGSPCTTKNIAPLTWYQTIGNHDVPLNTVQTQIDYSKYEPRWYFPCRYYAVDYINTLPNKYQLKVRIAYINTNPFVTKYSKSSNKYFGPEINSTATPAAISAQLDWLESVLKSGKANGYKLVVVGHHPAVSGSPTVYGPFNITDPGTETDAGKPDLNGVGAFTRLYNILNAYNVIAYFNGHDHILSHQVDPIDPTTRKTQYITTGAGSYGDAADGCGLGQRSYVKWVAGTYAKGSNCANTVGTGYVGYNIAKITPNSMTVSYYQLKDYKTDATDKAYTFSVPC